MQAQLEDGVGLALGQLVGAVLGQLVIGIVDQRDVGRHVGGGPGPLHQPPPRRRRIGRCPDEADHLVQIGDRDGEADRPVRALPRLVQLEDRAPGDDLLTELEERLQDVAETHQLRAPAGERQHVDAEARLQRRELVELVQHDVGDGIALQLDDDADAVAIALVAELGNAVDQLLVHHLGDALDQTGLVLLERHLGDDDRLAILADLLDGDAAAHLDRATTCAIGLQDAVAAHDDAAGREVRPRHVHHQLFDCHVRVVDQRHGGVDHLAEVMRRDVGRHADGDAAGAVDQEVRELGRKDGRLAVLLVIVRLEVDGVAVDVAEQRLGRPGQPRLGVTHGGGRIAVHGTEIALPLDQRQAHREALRHPHHGVVDRGVSVRVVLAHHVADDARTLAGDLRPVVAAFHHGVEDAAMDRLQAVAHVRQRPRHDHAHGVVEVGATHLLFDCDGNDVRRRNGGRH